MILNTRAQVASLTACARPSLSPRIPQRTATLVIKMRSTKDNEPNIYNDRNAKIRTGAGGKDAGAMKKDQDDQFEYQQERLEWRRKNQGGGDVQVDREDDPKVNIPQLHGDDASGEFRYRGANRADDPPPSTDLASSENPLGNLIRKLTGNEKEEDEEDEEEKSS